MHFLADSSGAAAGGSLVLVFIVLVLVVLELAAYWMIFSKAGRPGILAIIPIVNIFVLQRIIGLPWWWIIILFIPPFDIAFAFIFALDLSRSYGRGTLFAIGLFFLTGIFVPILAFGGSSYVGPAGFAGRRVVYVTA